MRNGETRKGADYSSNSLAPARQSAFPFPYSRNGLPAR